IHTKITHCRFDQADCTRCRLRATDVIDCTFKGAILQRAALGPWHDGRGNLYQSVSFAHADLRDFVSTTGTFVDCDFSYARIAKNDFESSSFIRCKFAGELREVIFWDHGFKTGKPNPNPMEDVDFSEAKLHWVEFRRLN